MPTKFSDRDKDNPSSRKPILLTWRASAAPSKQTKKLPYNYSRKKPASEELQTSFQLLTFGYVGESALRLPVTRVALSEINEISDSLDPFCQLPYDLSLEDRRLFHSYLLVVPSNVYGTRSDSIFSSVRDVSFPISLSSPLTLQWMLIAAHGRFSGYGQPQDQARSKTALLRRKHRAYQSLNDALQKNHQSVPDDVLGGIIMAIITESRLADAEAPNAHLLGYEIAVQLRGGLRSIILASSATQTSHMSHIMPYLACQPVASQSSVDTTQELTNFLNFFAGEVGYLGNMRMGNLRHTDLIGDSGFSFMAPLKLQPFITKFLLDTELAGYVQPVIKESLPYMDQSSQFLSLYLIALTLYRLDDSQGFYTERFLRHICAVLGSSSTYDRTGKPLLTAQGFLWVVVKAVLDLGDMFYLGEMRAQHRAQTIVNAVEALKVFRKMRSFLARNEVTLFLGRSLVTQKTRDETFWRGGWVQEHDR